MSWNQAPQPVVMRSFRRVGEIRATVTVEESGTDDLEITQHPVQRGAAVTDHAYLKPAALSMRLAWNDNERPLEETYQQLLDLQAQREPFEIVTGKRVYRDMLFKSLGVTTDKTSERMLSVNCSFLQVIIVDVVVSNIPPRANQKTPGKTGATQKAGAKQAKPETTAQPARKSGLKQVFGS